jgi:hypothetical protein
MCDVIAQLPPVRVCGLIVLLDDEPPNDPLGELEEPKPDDPPSSPKKPLPLEDDDPLLPDADVPLLDVDDDTTVLVVVAWASLHAITPPSPSSVATLAAPTARLVRRAFGFFWSVIAGSRCGSLVLD